MSTVAPHRAPIAGVEQRIETASLVLCYSRMLFFQAYPVFTRFYCKVFLTEPIEYLSGAAATCLIDNTHVVVSHGTGREMVPAPEMEAFARRYSFTFRAHEKGDANRSAHVERRFGWLQRIAEGNPICRPDGGGSGGAKGRRFRHAHGNCIRQRSGRWTRIGRARTAGRGT